MIRHAAAIVVVLSIPQPVAAEDAVFTVKTATANVHKAPSTGSPVIGHVRQGAKLEVTRELGSWVRIAWPRGEDGVGYVHVSMGAIARATQPPKANAAAPAGAVRPAAPPPSQAPAAPRPEPDRAGASVEPPRAIYVRPPSHLLAFGGELDAPTIGVGAGARAWSGNRWGAELVMSRAAAGDLPQRVTAVDVSPSALFALGDRVMDYWWLRPYVGAGPILQHRTVNAGIDGLAGSSDTRFGFQTFGGVEASFASMPRLAVSAALAYRSLSTDLAGADSGGVGLSVSLHWYLR